MISKKNEKKSLNLLQNCTSLLTVLYEIMTNIVTQVLLANIIQVLMFVMSNHLSLLRLSEVLPNGT